MSLEKYDEALSAGRELAERVEVMEGLIRVAGHGWAAELRRALASYYEKVGNESPAVARGELAEAVARFLDVCDDYGCSIGRGAGLGHETLDGLYAAFNAYNEKQGRG